MFGSKYSFPQFRAHLAADPSRRAALLLGYMVHHAPSSRLARRAPPHPAGHELAERCAKSGIHFFSALCVICVLR
jgi:hypothetical protein